MLFIAVSLAGLLLLTLSLRLRLRLGLIDYNRWFLDSYAVLASSDAAMAGMRDAHAPNPYDVLNRPNSYSDWWLVLGRLGLTREDNFLVGGGWVLAFLAAVFLTLRPRTWGEAVWLALLTASPPVMLGVIRANNDLAVFAVLAAVVLALRTFAIWRLALALAAISLATGLKFYPAAAAAVFLLIPQPRRMLAAVGCAIVVVGGVLVSVFDQLERGAFAVGQQLHVMGGRIWPDNLGMAEQPGAAFALGLFGMAAVALAWRGWTSGLAAPEEELESRVAMVLAGSVLAACFLGTINHAYRWVFALWLAPWLWRKRGEQGAAMTAVWLLPFVLWHDSLLCLALSGWFPNLEAGQYDRILRWWWLGTEPFTWLLMCLLGGWLGNLALTRLRDVREGIFQK